MKGTAHPRAARIRLACILWVLGCLLLPMGTGAAWADDPPAPTGAGEPGTPAQPQETPAPSAPTGDEAAAPTPEDDSTATAEPAPVAKLFAPDFLMMITPPPAGDGWTRAGDPTVFGWDQRVFLVGWTREVEGRQQGICLLVQRMESPAPPAEWATALRLAYGSKQELFTEWLAEGVISHAGQEGVEPEETWYVGITGPASLPGFGRGEETGAMLVGLVSHGPDVIQAIATAPAENQEALRAIVDRMLGGLTFTGETEPLPAAPESPADDQTDDRGPERGEGGAGYVPHGARDR